MGKKRKPRKQNHPKTQGRKQELFAPKRTADHRFPQMQKQTARGANRPSGHSPKKK